MRGVEGERRKKGCLSSHVYSELCSLLGALISGVPVMVNTTGMISTSGVPDTGHTNGKVGQAVGLAENTSGLWCCRHATGN